MKRKNVKLQEKVVTIESLKQKAIEYAAGNKFPNKRNRGVRRMNLIQQLLSCYRISCADFEINSMKVKYAQRPLRNKSRKSPIYKIWYTEKHSKYVEKEAVNDAYGDWDHTKKTVTPYTLGIMKMEIIIPDEECKCSTRIFVEASCRLPAVGMFYTQLLRKLLYIYICDYVMTSCGYMALDGLELYTPYTDTFNDSENIVRYNVAN
jgi:hypothetical protein